MDASRQRIFSRSPSTTMSRRNPLRHGTCSNTGQGLRRRNLPESALHVPKMECCWMSANIAPCLPSNCGLNLSYLQTPPSPTHIRSAFGTSDHQYYHYRIKLLFATTSYSKMNLSPLRHPTCSIFTPHLRRSCMHAALWNCMSSGKLRVERLVGSLTKIPSGF
ncbi:hypothetical protein CYLTODRAFT_261507 [Cylindrobasidium torrendii FP15055 ss-10]|uniref:Uncharacterized protein n=1 Tax=Cylindrobasidium torrendii FP15055 ss-10 TaxID=1314674 RepID=A0A0D7BE02_9AGAR|nr:hypothetical protein CYLTODRAFT_261507 [Cylindrobasidium torrendii FP15055 ss-10]